MRPRPGPCATPPAGRRAAPETGRQVEVWFEFSSPYSYLTLMRAGPALAEAGLAPAWRPFLLGPILKRRGFGTSPFVLDPLRGEHMWRDVQRRAALFGLPFRRPARFPLNGLTAARVMTAALAEPWAGDFARAIGHAAFAGGEDIADPVVISGVLEALGKDAGQWLARARDAETRAALRARTEQAAGHGIFGAPTFRVGGEIFWGDDRLEEAILRALDRHPGCLTGPDPRACVPR